MKNKMIIRERYDKRIFIHFLICTLRGKLGKNKIETETSVNLKIDDKSISILMSEENGIILL